MDVERNVTEPNVEHFNLITKAGNTWDGKCEGFCHWLRVYFFKFPDIKQALEVKGNAQIGWLEPQEQKYATSISNLQHMEGFEEAQTLNLTKSSDANRNQVLNKTLYSRFESF